MYGVSVNELNGEGTVTDLNASESEEVELARRIELLEKPENQGPDFKPVDWMWIGALGVLLPVLLLLWGWF